MPERTAGLPQSARPLMRRATQIRAHDVRLPLGTVEDRHGEWHQNGTARAGGVR